MSLSSKLKGKSLKQEPFWKGPEVDGITQSLINLKIVCPDRFRVATILGLRTEERFNKSIDYGNLWHVCEEALAQENDWRQPLYEKVEKFCKRYPLDREEIYKWYNVCMVQFPVYVKHWKKHPDVMSRSPLHAEVKFKIPYELPSGRVVFLRGKFDSIDLVTKGENKGIWLQENKTKGDLDETSLKRQLLFDLQTMFYTVAFVTWLENSPKEALPNLIGKIPEYKGVRYNVVRRPLAGGKGSIRRHQPTKSNPKGESEAEYYQRLAADYLIPEPEYWFMRWNSEISRHDIEVFKKEFLNPFLENLCLWYDYHTKPEYYGVPSQVDLSCLHWRTPFGIYNPIIEAGVTDLDEFLISGSMVGLTKARTLFPELEDED